MGTEGKGKGVSLFVPVKSRHLDGMFCKVINAFLSFCHSFVGAGESRGGKSLGKYLTIRLRARVFYEQIVNEAQPS